MPVLLPHHSCPGCGLTHDLCDTGPGPFATSGIYAYTCPVTRKQVNFRPTGAGTYVTPCPADVVMMRRVDSGP